jgi:hypothetical protein
MLELTYTSPYLIVDTKVSIPLQLQREKGGVGKVSPISWAHTYLSANNANNQQKKGKYEMKKGREGV